MNIQKSQLAELPSLLIAKSLYLAFLQAYQIFLSLNYPRSIIINYPIHIFNKFLFLALNFRVFFINILEKSQIK